MNRVIKINSSPSSGHLQLNSCAVNNKIAESGDFQQGQQSVYLPDTDDSLFRGQWACSNKPWGQANIVGQKRQQKVQTGKVNDIRHSFSINCSYISVRNCNVSLQKQINNYRGK